MNTLLKTRYIPIKGLNVDGGEDRLTEIIQKLPGVVQVTPEMDSERIMVRYDLFQINMKSIEDKIVEAGVRLGDGWFKRLLRSIHHFTEQNERDNHFAGSMPCCSHPDHFLEKSRKFQEARSSISHT